MKLLITDGVCPKPYTVQTLEDGVLGGTEAGVARLSRELSKRYSVYVSQLRRTDVVEDSFGIRYSPYEERIPVKPDKVITLRDGKVFRIMNETYKESQHYIWMHDIVYGDYKDHLEQTVLNFPTHFIAVSEYHKFQIMGQFPDQFQKGIWKITVVTNFIENMEKTPLHLVDPFKLIFTSSPHKGLEHTLKAFEVVRARDSRFKLYIANPGYFKSIETIPEGVINLGVMNHAKLMEEVGTSLCLFYPNITFPETFGLVYAESNAKGTPVLAHDIGAAREIVTTPQQIIDCTNFNTIADTVIKWSQGERPIVKVKEQYTIKEALKDWIKFLNPMHLIK